MTPAANLSRRARRARRDARGPLPLAPFFGLNALLLFGFYLLSLRELRSRGDGRFVHLDDWIAILAHALSVYLGGAALQLAAARAVLPRLPAWLGGAGAVLAAALVAAFVYVDNRVYLLLGVHLYSPLVIEAFRNAQVNRDVHLDAGTATSVLSVVLLLLAAETGLYLLLRRRALPWRRLRLPWLGLALPGLLLTLFHSGSVLHNSSPLAAVLPWHALLVRPPGSAAREQRFAPEYPQAGVRPVLHRRPDVLLVAVESLRGDAYGPELMPSLDRRARELRCLVPRRHYSGSHVTERGLFSLLYGLDSYLYAPFAERALSSYPLQLLKDNGYRVSGASSGLSRWNRAGFMTAQLDPYTEFRPERAWQRDEEMLAWAARYYRIFGAAGRERRPFFLFLFFDSTHIDYSYPPAFEKDRPVLPEGWVRTLARPSFLQHKDRIVNRYRNSVRYVDSLIDRLLGTFADDLARGNLVLIVTGDHGESFWEQGVFSHVAFGCDDAKVRVPLLLCLPDRPGLPGDLELSGHADVMPTLLDYLGTAPPLAEKSYASGASLLGGPRPYALMSGAGYPEKSRDLCLITPRRKYWLEGPAETARDFRLARAYDAQDRPLADETGPPAALLEDLARRQRRFTSRR